MNGTEITMANTCYRILLVHNHYRFAGGEDSVVQNEKCLLEAHGHSVTVYERDNTELDDYSFLNKIRLALHTIYSFSSNREIRRLIKQEHIDIVHVHNTLPLISFSAYYAAKKEGCALIQTIHNFRLLCPNGLFYRDGAICQDCLKSLGCSVKHACYRDSRLQSVLVAFNLKLHRILGTFLLPDAYITLTEFNRKILSVLIPSEKLYLKPNFTDVPVSFSGEKKRDYYLYASRLDSSKGIFLALDTFAQLPHEKLIIIGAGPQQQQVLDYISEHHLSNVNFLGYTPHEQTLSYLYHAKALLFPSQLYEGFPVVIAESLSLGTPVIGGNIGNTASIIQDGITGLLFPYDSVDGCADVIRTFSSATFPFCKMEENCRRIFRQQYSPEENYQQLMRIYENVMS